MTYLLNTSASQPTYSIFNVSDASLNVETYQLDGTMVDSFDIIDN